MKLIIAVLLSATFSFSLFADCLGWHEFAIVEQQDMQFLGSYLNRFRPRLECGQELTGKQAIRAAKEVLAAYKECALCSEPDVDYKTLAEKIGNRSYQFCTTDTPYSVGPWSWDSITTLMPTQEIDGYNLSFIKTAME